MRRTGPSSTLGCPCWASRSAVAGCRRWRGDASRRRVLAGRHLSRKCARVGGLRRRRHRGRGRWRRRRRRCRGGRRRHGRGGRRRGRRERRRRGRAVVDVVEVVGRTSSTWSRWSTSWTWSRWSRRRRRGGRRGRRGRCQRRGRGRGGRRRGRRGGRQTSWTWSRTCRSQGRRCGRGARRRHLSVVVVDRDLPIGLLGARVAHIPEVVEQVRASAATATAAPSLGTEPAATATAPAVVAAAARATSGVDHRSRAAGASGIGEAGVTRRPRRVEPRRFRCAQPARAARAAVGARCTASAARADEVVPRLAGSGGVIGQGAARSPVATGQLGCDRVSAAASAAAHDHDRRGSTKDRAEPATRPRFSGARTVDALSSHDHGEGLAGADVERRTDLATLAARGCAGPAGAALPAGQADEDGRDASRDHIRVTARGQVEGVDDRGVRRAAGGHHQRRCRHRDGHDRGQRSAGAVPRAVRRRGGGR